MKKWKKTVELATQQQTQSVMSGKEYRAYQYDLEDVLEDVPYMRELSTPPRYIGEEWELQMLHSRPQRGSGIEVKTFRQFLNLIKESNMPCLWEIGYDDGHKYRFTGDDWFVDMTEIRRYNCESLLRKRMKLSERHKNLRRDPKREYKLRGH